MTEIYNYFVMPKKYKKWAKMKSIIEKFRPGFHASPGDILWAYIGTNIGKEICGHGDGIKRPILVLRRHGSIYLVIPITSKGIYYDKEEGLWFIKENHKKITSGNTRVESYLILNQIKTIDMKRFVSKYTKISPEELIEIKEIIKETIL